MKKLFLITIFLLSALCLFVGCSEKEDNLESASGVVSENEYGTIEDYLDGTWDIGAVNIEEMGLIELSDLSSNFYDGAFLIFDKDHEFIFSSFYTYSGTYQISDNAKNVILVPDTTLSSSDGELVETPFDQDFHFLVTILDENTISVAYCYPETGKIKPDSELKLYVREGTVSQYIEAHKTDMDENRSAESTIPPNTESENPSHYDDPPEYNENSYEGILDTYTDLMNYSVDALVQEYNRESSGIYDMDTLAEICNEKIGVLAEICNEGIGEMASLMHRNGDSYDTYEYWADKLMDQYLEISDAIMDAYLESPVY